MIATSGNKTPTSGINAEVDIWLIAGLVTPIVLEVPMLLALVLMICSMFKGLFWGKEMFLKV